MTKRSYTMDDVKRYREETECSAREAFIHFEKLHFIGCVDTARLDEDFDLLCDVVRELVLKAKFA